MGQFMNIIVFVCVLSACAFGAGAEPSSKPSTPTLPMLLTTVGQTQVILHDMRDADQRLVLELRSPDVTSMPSRGALHLTFDARISNISEPSTPMPLRLETAVTDQQVTFFLARDPFAFPQPWSYTVTIAFHQLPQTGAVTWGNLTPQKVTYPSPPPAGQVNTLPGT
ncbi:hypothetical protein [Candidatus Entotheonella palauensis]|uniref:Uncharacterized protein n=1 Tax=Candidatus Entotheonella gemina TaxID=1429439 RepID=W4LCH5_9BACT|nr:hypothetical protein [Candidatus Entotheonella palauensis]ETW95026.1 MAG: hypothetical protein ETSY2_48730 [Candidatus Entotheonella gemina]